MRSTSNAGGGRERCRRALAGFGLLAGILASVAVASPGHAARVAAPHVQVELLADASAFAPGQAITVGIHFLPEQEWHVYWRNPGDSGEAPRVEWTLPPGLTAGALEWPAPTRLEVGPLVSFGFPGETLLTAPISVAPTIDAPTTLALAAHARWLVCNRDECIPGNALLSLSLPIGPTTAATPEVARLFAAAGRELPHAAPASWRLAASADPEHVTLTVRGSAPPASAPFFFPYDRDPIQSSAPQRLSTAPDGFRLELARRSGASLPATLAGVLRIGEHAYEVSAPVGPPIGPSGASALPVDSPVAASGTSVLPIALAFAGGLLLNLMPCVFPVLALKALALAGLAGEARRRIRRHGLVYAAGVVVSFWMLAGMLLAARAGGAELGWGFQLQSPVMIAILAGLFFWMALVLLDVSPFGGAIMGFGQHLTVGDGDRAAFFTGILATVVATPCTAPFMGTAIGYALAQPAATALAVFTSLGLGLACPYVLVTFVPTLAAWLPRPGPWMETLKQLLAFPLLATVVWLVWVASFQAGPPAVGAILAGLVLLAFAAWTMRRWRGAGGRLIAIAATAAAVGLSVTITPLDHDLAAPTRGANAPAELTWEPFSSTRIAELRAQGRPVFVDFTAAWCVTCQVNKQVALETREVTAKMQALGVAAMRADWTRPDAEITRALHEFGRDGVPLYLLYSGRRNDPPRILPQILTPSIVIAELDLLEAPESTSGAEAHRSPAAPAGGTGAISQTKRSST